MLTHLHFDHAGGLALLPPSVPIVVQRREWEAATTRRPPQRNFFCPRDYAGVADRRLMLVDGDHDLLGDGSIELLFTPGHTPGHQSVRVGERLVIGGDVSHFAVGPRRPPLPDLRRRLRGAGGVRRAPARAARRGDRGAPGHDPEVLEPGPISLAL